MTGFLKKSAWLIMLALVANTAAGSEPAKLGEKLLAALGGEAAWKNVQAVHNTAINHHPQARLPYIQEYWYFTGSPKHIVKINNHDMNRMRAYTEQGGWSMLRGEVNDFSAERHANELMSWRRSLYRKVFLLANRSPDLRLAIGADGSLEFYDAEQFIGWMMINEGGTPTRHGGTESRDIYTEFDELAQFGNIYWPMAGKDESGWRFEMLSIEALDDEPGISTEPPI